MARSYSPNDLIALPRLSANATARLLFELLKAARDEKKLPAAIVADRDELAHAHEDLAAALKDRVRAAAGQTPVVRAADMVEDNAFGAFVDWLRAFARLPADKHPEATIAAAVLEAVFPEGLGFLAIQPADEWQEAETRLGLLAEEHHEAAIKKLGGGAFLAEIKRAHKAYGEALGITGEKRAAAAGTVREPLDAAHEALRSYVLRVSAQVRKRDAESAALAGRLLAPLVAWKDRPIKAEDGAEADPGGAGGGPVAPAGAGLTREGAPEIPAPHGGGI